VCWRREWCWEVNMSSQIERKERRQKLRGESVCRNIVINAKVTDDEKFMRCGCSEGENISEVIEKDR